MIQLIYVGIGGFIGAIFRYIITINSTRLFNTQIPFGTLIVNILGGILIGFVMEITLKSDMISNDLRLLIVTGILGGLTTFSTFSYETINLFSVGNYFSATLNIFLNVLLSLGGVLLGRIIPNALNIIR